MRLRSRTESTDWADEHLRVERYQRWVVVRQVGQFVALAVIAVVIVGVATAIASRRAGERGHR